MKSKNEISISHSTLKYSFYWHKPLPFIGGIAPTPVTKLPPSFAYKKIEEVLSQMILIIRVVNSNGADISTFKHHNFARKNRGRIRKFSWRLDVVFIEKRVR